jgi:hypothetical protein
MKFNINDSVRVKLTDHGRDIWYHRNDELNKKFNLHPPLSSGYPLEVDGWFEEQLWVIMNVFGPHLYNGCKQVFEKNVMEILEEIK